MFCSSRGKNLFCADGRGPEQVENDDNGRNMPMWIKNNNNNNNDNNRVAIRNADNNDESDGGRGILDALVVNALKNLTFEDRQRFLNEQHGVQDHNNKEKSSPEFVAYKLDELEAELNMQLMRRHMETSLPWLAPSVSSPPGVLLAKAMDPNFVRNTYRLRLRVLRAEFYDAAKAAARMIRYFDLKKEVFGPERICKNITFDDLNSDDVDALNKGFLQYIQGRDSAGRRIIVVLRNIMTVEDPKSLARLYLYFDSFVNANEFDNGYVILSFHLGPPPKDVKNGIFWLKESLVSYPDSPSAIHICFYPNDRHHHVVKASVLL